MLIGITGPKLWRSQYYREEGVIVEKKIQFWAPCSLIGACDQIYPRILNRNHGELYCKVAVYNLLYALALSLVKNIGN